MKAETMSIVQAAQLATDAVQVVKANVILFIGQVVEHVLPQWENRSTAGTVIGVMLLNLCHRAQRALQESIQ